MEIIFIAVALLVAGWFWRAKQYDKQTTLDFDFWLHKYDSASSPSQRSAMAVALVQQSIHFAWVMGAFNSKQRDVITRILKGLGSTTTMVQWRATSLPAVVRVLGEHEVANSPARVIGALMLVAWASEKNERENAVRNFLSLTH